MELTCKFVASFLRSCPPTGVRGGVLLAFLDHKALFPGHSLLVPKSHNPTLPDLPACS